MRPPVRPNALYEIFVMMFSPTSWLLKRSFFALTALSAVINGALAAGPVRTPHVEAELVARQTAIVPGQPIEVALRLKIIDHWHTYWQNPGDSGLPTRLAWTMPAGYVAGLIQWPHPRKLPLGPLMNFGYEGEVLHLVTIQPPADLKAGGSAILKAKADWLVCSDVCIPEDAQLSITLPVRSGPFQDASHVLAAKVAIHRNSPLAQLEADVQVDTGRGERVERGQIGVRGRPSRGCVGN